MLTLALLIAAAPLQLAQAEAPPPQQQPPSDDFDLLPKEATPDPAALAKQQEIERKLELRRKMLNLHQLGGFATLASMAITVALGQAYYTDKYGGHGDSGTWTLWHRYAGYTSAAIFAGTASMAVFAPVPIEKKFRLDTATLHKICMFTAAAGMTAQIVLGIITTGRDGQINQRDFALAHQIIGYGTLVAAGAGFTVLTFN